MENTQKPSLFLVGNHLKMTEPGTPFTETMLSWPIVSFIDYPTPCTNNERNTILRNVLQALANLSPFHAKISVTAEIENERLSYEFRTWGKIFLNEQNVLTFSYYADEKNKPFFNIEDWVEEGKYANAQGKLGALAEWSVNDWIEFFKKKIMARSTHLQNKADKKREDAQALEDSANSIRTSLDTIMPILLN